MLVNIIKVQVTQNTIQHLYTCKTVSKQSVLVACGPRSHKERKYTRKIEKTHQQ